MPHFVDVHIGAMIRRLRILRSLSQDQLGDAVGVKFQQIQKYETGMNRVSASRLHDIALVLGTPVGNFFADLDDSETKPQDSFNDVLTKRETIKFTRQVCQLPPAQRGTLRKFMQSLAAMYETEKTDG